jgi:hypothetical protein
MTVIITIITIIMEHEWKGSIVCEGFHWGVWNGERGVFWGASRIKVYLYAYIYFIYLYKHRKMA